MNITITTSVNGESPEHQFHCQRVPAVKARSAGNAIRRVMEIDTLISRQRNEATRGGTLENAIRVYVMGLDQIDFRECPRDFVNALRKHRDAWHGSIAYFARHGQLRGEMHELLDQIRTMDDQETGQLQQHFDAIMRTWGELEIVIKAYGAE